jgi:hypothetical protein
MMNSKRCKYTVHGMQCILTSLRKHCRCQRPSHCRLQLPRLQQLQRCTAHHQQHLPLPAVHHLTLLLLLLPMSHTAAAAAAV